MDLNYLFFCALLLISTVLIFCLSITKNIIVDYVFNSLIAVFIYFLISKFANNPDSFFIPFVISFLISSGLFFLYRKNEKNNTTIGNDTKYVFDLKTTSGVVIKFYYPFDNFLVYGGAGSGKTKSIGKPLLLQYILYHFAGFIYDYKDFDYTKTAYNMVKKNNYPYPFYYISFTDVSRSYRFNPIKPSVIKNENLLVQLMDDLLSTYLKDGRKDEWFQSALGILKGVAIRFYNDYPEYCTIPHIVNFIVHSGKQRLTAFLKGYAKSKATASAFVDAEDSEKTQASMLSSLTNYISQIANNEDICYILSGDDFDFNLIDPEQPKLVSICNSYSMDGAISPIIALLLSISTRSFKLGNKVPFFYLLDEATTFRIADFEKMPSVLREYNVSFTMLTQSGSKIEKNYGKLDRSSLEANFANQFFGRTKDLEALKYYPLFFGKKEIKKKTHTSGSSSNSENRSVSVSTSKEDVYESEFFTKLEPGDFIGNTGRSNVKTFNYKFEQYTDEEDELPVVNVVLPSEIRNNYDKILEEIFLIS